MKDGLRVCRVETSLTGSTESKLDHHRDFAKRVRRGWLGHQRRIIFEDCARGFARAKATTRSRRND